jgi:hypothetical protein
MEINKYERTPKKIIKEYKKLGRSKKQIRTLARYMTSSGSLSQKKIGISILSILKRKKKLNEN